VSSKEGTFSKEGGHESRENFSVSFGPKFFFLLWEAVLYGSYSSYDSVQSVRIWHEIEAALGTDFEADFSFLFTVSGPYGTVRTTDCGHEKRGTEVVVQQYGFGTKNEADFCGTDLVL
jgi:hypothetical protein